MLFLFLLLFLCLHFLHSNAALFSSYFSFIDLLFCFFNSFIQPNVNLFAFSFIYLLFICLSFVCFIHSWSLSFCSTFLSLYPFLLHLSSYVSFFHCFLFSLSFFLSCSFSVIISFFTFFQLFSRCLSRYRLEWSESIMLGDICVTVMYGMEPVMRHSRW